MPMVIVVIMIMGGALSVVVVRVVFAPSGRDAHPARLNDSQQRQTDIGCLHNALSVFGQGHNLIDVPECRARLNDGVDLGLRAGLVLKPQNVPKRGPKFHEQRLAIQRHEQLSVPVHVRGAAGSQGVVFALALMVTMIVALIVVMIRMVCRLVMIIMVVIVRRAVMGVIMVVLRQRARRARRTHEPKQTKRASA